MANAVISNLMKRADAFSGFHQDNRPLFRAGEWVKLVDGPLIGLDAIFEHQDGEKRVVLLLDLLGKTNKVTLNRDWVARAA